MKSCMASKEDAVSVADISDLQWTLAPLFSASNAIISLSVDTQISLNSTNISRERIKNEHVCVSYLRL